MTEIAYIENDEAFIDSHDNDVVEAPSTARFWNPEKRPESIDGQEP